MTTALTLGQSVEVKLNRAGSWRSAIVREVWADGRISVSFTDIPEGYVLPAGHRRAATVRNTPGAIRPDHGA